MIIGVLLALMLVAPLLFMTLFGCTAGVVYYWYFTVYGTVGCYALYMFLCFFVDGSRALLVTLVLVIVM